MVKQNVEKVLKNGKNGASEIISEASLKTQKSLVSLWKMASDILPVGGASVVLNGSGSQTLDEPLSSISYLSVFIPHFIGRPAKNREILRKLYLDFDLSTYQISDLTGWSRTAISEFFRREKITKHVIKSANLKYGELAVGGLRIPHQSELTVIQKILFLRANGTSFQEIARTLNDSGFLARKGGQWSKTTVQQIYNRVQEKQK